MLAAIRRTVGAWPTEVKLPRLGQGMESGTIVKWLKSEGDAVEKGEPLYELDTDKVTQEVEAEASGVLLKIAVTEGEVAVGRTIGFIGDAGRERRRTVAAERAGCAGGRRRGAGSRRTPAPRADADARRRRTDGRIKASPLARRIARERGVDLAAVRGTGPDGRIVAEDVERAEAQTGAPVAAVAAAPVPAGEVERRPLSNIRKTIARRLTEAWTVPAFQLTVDVDMTRADGARRSGSASSTRTCASRSPIC